MPGLRKLSDSSSERGCKAGGGELRKCEQLAPVHQQLIDALIFESKSDGSAVRCDELDVTGHYIHARCCFPSRHGMSTCAVCATSS